VKILDLLKDAISLWKLGDIMGDSNQVFLVQYWSLGITSIHNAQEVYIYGLKINCIVKMAELLEQANSHWSPMTFFTKIEKSVQNLYGNIKDPK
jgi:hypothetical protein